MKEPLRGIRFRTVPEILQAVDRSIRTINTTGAAKFILRLPLRWQRVVHNAGDVCWTLVKRYFGTTLRYHLQGSSSLRKILQWPVGMFFPWRKSSCSAWPLLLYRWCPETSVTNYVTQHHRTAKASRSLLFSTASPAKHFFAPINIEHVRGNACGSSCMDRKLIGVL